METGTQGQGPFSTGTSQGMAGEAKENAKQLTRTARARALSALDQQKAQLSGLLDRVGDTVHDDRIGQYASDYAHRGAEFLRRQSSEEIFGAVRRSVGQRPGLVLSACFVAGLAFARLMREGAGNGEGRFGAGQWSEGRS